MSQQQEQEHLLNPKMSLNVLANLCMAHVTPLEVLFRVPGTVGSRYFGKEAFWAFLYIPLFVIFAGPEGRGQAGIILFWGLYLVLLFVHRASSQVRWNQGCREHSRYIGDSWFGSLNLPGFKDDNHAKKVWEPIACIVLGLIALPFSPPLGWYFLIGTATLAVPMMIIERRDRQRQLDLQDSSIEAARMRQWSEQAHQ
jgi:hypothetical protein